MNRLISFICSYTNLMAIEARFIEEFPVEVMDWRPGMAEVRGRALLPLTEHETDKWIFAWDDSPFSFGPPDPLVKKFLRERRDHIFYVLVGTPEWESEFEKDAVDRLGKIYHRADGTPDTDAIAAHAFFMNYRTKTGLERLIEMLSRTDKTEKP